MRKGSRPLGDAMQRDFVERRFAHGRFERPLVNSGRTFEFVLCADRIELSRRRGRVCREEQKQDQRQVKGNASSNLHWAYPLHNFASSHKCARGANPSRLTLRRAACETEGGRVLPPISHGAKFNEQESRVRFVLSASRTIVASARRAGASMREARLPFDL